MDKSLTNQKMADVELSDGRDGGYLRSGAEIESMASVAFKTRFCSSVRRHYEPGELDLGSIARRRAVGTCMELNCSGAEFTRDGNLGLIRIDKQGNSDTRRPECRNEGRKQRSGRNRIQTAFRRQFLAPLRHETAGVRSSAKCEIPHPRRARHFQV